MEKDKIVIRLYEILTKENQGEIVISKHEEADFDDGLDQGRAIEERYFSRELTKLIKEIKRHDTR